MSINRHKTIIWLLIACLNAYSSFALADSGEYKVFKEQFQHHRNKMDELMRKVIESEDQSVEIRNEIFALTKLIHRLEEEISRSSIKQQKNKTDFLLLAQGCQAIDFVLVCLDNYAATKDRIFTLLARKGVDLLNDVEQSL